MKPLSTVLVSSLILAAAAVPAQAASGDQTGFYIGLDGRIDQISWKSKNFDATYTGTSKGSSSTTTGSTSSDYFPEAPMGVGLRLGYRFSPYLSAELGISDSYDENRIMDNDSNKLRYRMSIREIQLDGYAFWPLGASGRFRPFLTAGLAYASGDARMRADILGTDGSGDENDTMTTTHYFQRHEVDWRAGMGLEIGITETVNGRVYVRYQPYSFGGALDGGATLGFSLNFLSFTL
ncbi:MAG: outer membrane beta-barrel protein [Rhizomicrobium sp.]